MPPTSEDKKMNKFSAPSFSSVLTAKQPPKKTNNKIDMIRETSMRFLFLFAKRFIAGETLEEAIPVLKKLKAKGFLTTIDILGESVSKIDDAKDACDSYCNLINTLKENDVELNVSLKPTMLGLDITEQLCYENVCKILDEASEVDGFVRIDMEGSNCTDATLRLVHKWHDGYPKVGTVIQAMLKRSPKDIESLLKDGITVRLCKGAYKEPPEIAFKDKADVDNQYAELSTHLLNSGLYHGIATHDEKLIKHVQDYVTHHNLSKDSFEFQMLYGIRSRLQEQLIKDGWRVRVYVPYGKHWLKYTLRRLRERKENVWFVAKNLIRR